MTKAGLDQPVGESAINSVPRKMITAAVLEIAEKYDYHGGFCVELSVPDGEKIAKKNTLEGVSVYVSKAHQKRKKKALNIMMDSKSKDVVYTVDYIAYVNENHILSIAIRSILKEGNNAQRTIIQTYNYDFKNSKEIKELYKVYFYTGLTYSEGAFQSIITIYIIKVFSDSFSLGIFTSIFLRLLTLAPFMVIFLCDIK